MPNQIYIDGVNYTKWCSGLDDLTESYSKRDDGTIELGQTSQVVMDGEGFDYWRSIFIDDSCNSIDREYEVRIWISSCSQSQYYVLKAQGVSIDDVNCKVKMNLNVKNDNDEKIEILRKTYFWDLDEGFIDYALGLNRIPKMTYVKELTYISKVLIYFWFAALLPIRAIIRIILNFLSAIVSIINGLGGNVTDPKDKFDEFEESVENDLLGGGEFSTVYYIKDIMEFWCDKAGLIFSSTIFQNSPYQHCALWSQQYRKGIELDKCNTIHFDEENAPNVNVIELLVSLSGVFNAQWAIIDNVLYFERHDFYDTKKETVFNLDTEVRRKNITQDWEYNFDAEKNCARFFGEYLFDSVDTQGNRARGTLYTTIKEYNPGRIYKNRKGDCKPDVPFGAARFTHDQNRNDFNSWMWDKADNLAFFDLGNINLTHSLVLTNDTATNFKLLVIDQNFNRSFKGCRFSYVVRTPFSPPTGGGFFNDSVGTYLYNMPMYFTQDVSTDNLYDRFHYIENPDLKQHRAIEIASITWRPEDFCTAVNFVREHKLNTKITSKLGDGHIGSFTIDYGKCTITLQDIKFRCQST